jgi:hypothetical protein
MLLRFIQGRFDLFRTAQAESMNADSMIDSEALATTRARNPLCAESASAIVNLD